MSGKIKIVMLGMLAAALLLLPSLVQTGSPKVVYLKATFDDSTATRIHSDGKAPYQNASNVTVQFSTAGELQFTLGERSGRRLIYLFDSSNWLNFGGCEYCSGITGGELPDTAGSEPIVYTSFHTTIGSGYAGPQLNFLAMKPTDVALVRMWFYFETISRKYFRVKYFNAGAPEEFCAGGGPVQVQAIDTGTDGIVDRWIISPDPAANNKALFFKDYSRNGNDWHQCSFGYFTMPFQVTLDRIK